jgi:uncharacterized repeat protein (TIGR01451 family)
VVLLLGLGTTPSVAVSQDAASGAQDVRGVAHLVPSLRDAGFVTGGRNALYTATWTNNGRATLTNVVITVTLPAGFRVVSTDPDVCTFSPPDPSAPTVVTCPRDNLRSGDIFTQQVFFQTPAVSVETSAEVTSVLRGDERTSDPDRQHTDTIAPDPEPLTILPTAADAAGACVRVEDDPTIATQSGLSMTNPLITEASLTGPTGLFCTPLTLVEQHRSTPTEFCGEGATCTTDIAMTGAELVPATPIQLTFTFVGNNRNLTWYKTADPPQGEPVPPAEPVPSCLGATELPDNLVACVNSRAKAGPMAVRLGVLWQGGPDPSWVG